MLALVAAGHLVVQEVVNVRGVVPDQPRNDVAAHAVPARVVGRVLLQHLHEHVGVEHVDAHARPGLVRAAGAGRRIGGLLQECLDAVAVRRGLHHPEVCRLYPRDGDRRDRGSGPAGQMVLDHLRRVHPVHVVGPDDRDDIWLLPVDEVQRLVDRVGRAGLPVRTEPLLGRHRHHVVAQQVAQLPGGGDVPVQAVALVLG